MSIGELINLYSDNEIDIHPEFQRVFRWTQSQRVRLIESIMLNIPIPSIFVSQREDGVWDVVDGVQRLSTIFELAGVLRDENDDLQLPLKLSATDYLPALEGMMWQCEEDNAYVIPTEIKLSIKRARIGVTIVKKESDATSKYELFQRLNTGGTNLSDQEVRNCLMIMANKEFFELTKTLDSLDDFRACIPLSNRKTDEQYRIELIIRLLAGVYGDLTHYRQDDDLKKLLDDTALYMCEKDDLFDEMRDKFEKTFAKLNNLFGEDSFKKYDSGRDRFSGVFLSSYFQAIAVGMFNNIDCIDGRPDEDIRTIINNIKESPEVTGQMRPGTRAVPRLKVLSDFSKNTFQ